MIGGIMDQVWLARLCGESGAIQDEDTPTGVWRYELTGFTVEMVNTDQDCGTKIIAYNSGAVLFETIWFDYTDEQVEEIKKIFRTRA
jgi:hypothetical protein